MYASGHQFAFRRYLNTAVRHRFFSQKFVNIGTWGWDSLSDLTIWMMSAVGNKSARAAYVVWRQMNILQLWWLPATPILTARLPASYPDGVWLFVGLVLRNGTNCVGIKLRRVCDSEVNPIGQQLPAPRRKASLSRSTKGRKREVFRDSSSWLS